MESSLCRSVETDQAFGFNPTARSHVGDYYHFASSTASFGTSRLTNIRYHVSAAGGSASFVGLNMSRQSQGTSALEDEGMAALPSIFRRRGLFLLRSLATTNEWKQYVMCYETLEMANEQHLVDQIWESVGDLLDKVMDDDGSFGTLTWNWMSLLCGCVLSASLPVVRKMTMHRLLTAHELGEGVDTTKKGKQKPKSKRTFTAFKSFLAKLPPDFVLKILLPSWNSLAKSVGFTVHLPLEIGLCKETT